MRGKHAVTSKQDSRADRDERRTVLQLTDLPVTPIPGPPVVRPVPAAAASSEPAFGAILQRLSAGPDGNAEGSPVRTGEEVARPGAEAPDSSAAAEIPQPPVAAPDDPPATVRPEAEKAVDASEPGPAPEPTPAVQNEGPDAAEPASAQMPAVPVWFAPLPLPADALRIGRASGPETADTQGRPLAESVASPGKAKGAAPIPWAGRADDSLPRTQDLPDAEDLCLSRGMLLRPLGQGQDVTAQVPPSTPPPVVAGAALPPPAAMSLSLSPRALAGLARDKADQRPDDIAPVAAVAADTASAARLADIRLVAPPASLATLLPPPPGMPQPGRVSDRGDFAGLEVVPELAGSGGAVPAPSSAGAPPATLVFDAPRLPLRPMAVALTARPGEQVELLLAPEELGRVRLVLHTGAGGVSVHVMADRPETLDLMRRNVAELAGELEAMGFADASFAFGGDAQQDRPAPMQPPAPAASLALPGIGGPFHSLPPAVASPARTSAGGLDLRL